MQKPKKWNLWKNCTCIKSFSLLDDAPYYPNSKKEIENAQGFFFQEIFRGRGINAYHKSIFCLSFLNKVLTIIEVAWLNSRAFSISYLLFVIYSIWQISVFLFKKINNYFVDNSNVLIRFDLKEFNEEIIFFWHSICFQL